MERETTGRATGQDQNWLQSKNPLADAHAALDAAVVAAYGFSPKKDLLAQLLKLNLEVAGRIKAGERVTAPGVPPSYPNVNLARVGRSFRPLDRQLAA